MKRLHRKIEDLAKDLTPRQLVTALMFELQDACESVQDLEVLLDAEEYEGLLGRKALRGVKPGPDSQQHRTERLRDVCFYWSLATDMNMDVLLRREQMGLKIALTAAMAERELRSDEQVEGPEISNHSEGPISLQQLAAIAVTEVSGTWQAVERINRDYFGGEDMLFKEERLALCGMELLTPEANQLVATALGCLLEEIEEEAKRGALQVADQLVERWTTGAAREASHRYPVKPAKPSYR